MNREMGYEYGNRFVKMIMDGTIYKDCMPNHADEFTGGNEAYHLKLFESYLGSCACYMMDKRLEADRREYNG